MKKQALFGVWAVCLMLGECGLRAGECCPPDNPPDPNGGGGGGYNDPVFFYSQEKPAVSAVQRLADLGLVDAGGGRVSGEREQAALASYEEARQGDGARLMSVVDGIWAQPVAPSLKRYVLVSSLPLMKRTEDLEKLRFMLSALEDAPGQVERISKMARGNGLQKAQAVKLTDILMKNPQIKL